MRITKNKGDESPRICIEEESVIQRWYRIGIVMGIEIGRQQTLLYYIIREEKE